MYSSYAIYITILLAAVLLARYSDLKNSVPAKWWIIIMFTFFAGLRGPSVGLDTEMYLSKFILIGDGKLNLAYGFEISFKLICYVLMKIFHSETAVMLILALITNACIINRFWDFRRIASFPCMVCCYYMIFFFTSMNTVRQFCAIAIVFISTRQLTERRYLRYLIGVLIACMFHKSAIVGTVLLATEIIQWKNLEKKQKYFFVSVILISPAILYYVMTQLMRYEHYFSKVYIDIGSMNVLKLIFFTVTALLIFGVYRKENYIAKWSELTYRDARSIPLVCISYLLGLLLLFLGYVFRFADRIGWYFYIFECVYLGMIMKTNSRLNKLLFGLIVYFLLGWAFIYSMVHNSQGTMPYVFFWQ